MRHRRNATLLVVGLAVLTLAAADEPRSPDAKTAAAAYQRAMREADIAFDRAAAKAREDYRKAMKSALDKALTQKNLDEANRVRAAMDAVGGGEPQGVWVTHWSDGGAYKYEFGKEKLTLNIDATPLPSNKFVREGSTVTYWIPVREGIHVHRYRPASPYLAGEVWHSPSEFERGAPPLGICVARRVEK